MPYVRLPALMGARPCAGHVSASSCRISSAPITVVATLEFGLMVLFEAGLSFLGLGVQPPTASWGAMLSALAATTSPMPGGSRRFPDCALFLLVLSVNLIGDDVRDRLRSHAFDNEDDMAMHSSMISRASAPSSPALAA